MFFIILDQVQADNQQAGYLSRPTLLNASIQKTGILSRPSSLICLSDNTLSVEGYTVGFRLTEREKPFDPEHEGCSSDCRYAATGDGCRSISLSGGFIGR